MVHAIGYAVGALCIATAFYGFAAVGVQIVRSVCTRTAKTAVVAGYVPNTPLPTHNAR